MLKTRVIPILVVQDGLLKKPVQFKNPRTVANPISVVRVFEQRQVDELILLDRGRTVDMEDVDPNLVQDIAQELTVPFAVGGGVKSVDDMKQVIQAGAEKVVVNTAAVENPGLITSGADIFGNQCIVVSMDVMEREGKYEVYVRSGSSPTGLEAVDWAIEAEKRGAGELLVNSILHEGTMKGYDIDLIKSVAKAVNIPVVAAGGAGKLNDFVEVILHGHASAVAAGSIYHYTKYTPNMVKGALMSAGIPVRTYADEDYTVS